MGAGGPDANEPSGACADAIAKPCVKIGEKIAPSRPLKWIFNKAKPEIREQIIESSVGIYLI